MFNGACGGGRFEKRPYISDDAAAAATGRSPTITAALQLQQLLQFLGYYLRVFIIESGRKKRLTSVF